MPKPTPWSVKADDRTEADRFGNAYEYIGGWDIFAADGTEIVGCEGILADDEEQANHIVRAVNAHEGLLDALHTARIQLVTLGGDPGEDKDGDQIQAAVLNVIDAAIAKAEGR